MTVSSHHHPLPVKSAINSRTQTSHAISTQPMGSGCFIDPDESRMTHGVLCAIRNEWREELLRSKLERATRESND